VEKEERLGERVKSKEKRKDKGKRELEGEGV
jgi:hypothetical protein